MEIHKLWHGSSSYGDDALTRRWSLELRTEENYTFWNMVALDAEPRDFSARLREHRVIDGVDAFAVLRAKLEE
jgi:hypothetical protein